jgi:hypothetical protein
MMADFGSDGPPKFIVLSILLFYIHEILVMVLVKGYLESCEELLFWSFSMSFRLLLELKYRNK